MLKNSSEFENMFRTNDIMDIVDSFSNNELDILNEYDFFQYEDDSSSTRKYDNINVDDLAAFLSNDFTGSNEQQQQQQFITNYDHDFIDVESLSPKPTMSCKTESTFNSDKNVLILNGEKIDFPPSPQSSLAYQSDSDSICSIVEPTEVTRSINRITNTSVTRQTSKTPIIRKIKDQPCVNKKFKSVSNTNTNNNKISNILIGQNSNNNSNSDDENWPFLFSLNKLPQTGPLLLTEEEKRTYRQENIEIPTVLPLSKTQEKILKKIRRKIKNKISAQESRRKRKNYVDTLEKNFDCCKTENKELKKRLEDLELNNKNLMTQLQKIQNPQQSSSSANHFGTTILIIVLFFAVVLGIWPPMISKNRISPSNSPASSTNISNENSSDSNASENSMVESSIIKPFSPYSTSKVVVGGEVDFSSFDVSLKQTSSDTMNNSKNKFDLGNTHQISSIGRSKTGSAVELTKVRPFQTKTNQKVVSTTTTLSSNQSAPVLPKIITINSIDSNNQRKTTSEYIYINDTNKDAQIVIVNLPKTTETRTSSINMQLTNSVVNKTSVNTFTAIPIQTLTKVANSPLLNSNMKRIVHSESLQPAAKYRLIQS
jgi:hypothetical protein